MTSCFAVIISMGRNTQNNSGAFVFLVWSIPFPTLLRIISDGVWSEVGGFILQLQE